MSDLNKAVQMIAGVPVTPATIQRIQAIAHSLGMSENDAMMPILVMLDTYHGAFSGAPTVVAEAINKASQNVSGVIDAAANKSVAREVTNAKQDINSAAVAAVGGLTEVAKQAIIKAGNDIAGVDKENAKAHVIREQTALLKHYAGIGAALVLVAVLGGAGAMYGATSAKLYSAKQDVQAAVERAVSAENGSATAAAAAVDTATRKLRDELASVRAAARWAGTEDGMLVSTCQVPGWRIEKYKDGTAICVTREEQKNLIGKNEPAIMFWLQPPAATKK